MTDNDVTKLARYALQHTYTKGDLSTLCVYLDLLVANPAFTNDYGLLHIDALVNITIWKTCKDFSDPKEMLNNRRFLNAAIASWNGAYNSARAAKAQDLMIMLFNLNSMAARIYDQGFYVDNRQQKPNAEYRAMLREYAKKCLLLSNNRRNGAIAALHVCRDSLEQSALMNDQKLIKEDFTLLTQALEEIEEPKLTRKEMQEILLSELLQVNGANAIKLCPEFEKWTRQISQR